MLKRKNLIILITSILCIGIICGTIIILMNKDKKNSVSVYPEYTLDELKNISEVIVEGEIIGNPDPKFKTLNQTDHHYYQTYNFNVSKVLKGNIDKNVIKIRDYADDENMVIEGKVNFEKNKKYILTLFKSDEVKNKKEKTDYYSLVYEINGVFKQNSDNENEFTNILGYTMKSN